MEFNQLKLSLLTFIAIWIALANISGTLARYKAKNLQAGLPGSATVTVTPGTGMPLFPSPNVPEPCVDELIFNAQTISQNGIRLTWVYNLADCIASCSFVLQCVAIDYSDSKGCFAYLNPSGLLQSFLQPDATQVIITRCPADLIYTCFETFDDTNKMINICASTCTPQWMQVIDSVGYGGIIVVDASPTNASTCLSYCFFNIKNCVGVDWVYGGPSQGYTCSYYTTDTTSAMTAISVQANSVQYRLVDRCADYCECIFTPFINTRYQLLNFTILKEAKSLADCSNACTISPTCTAYQVNNSGPINCIIADDFFITSFTHDAKVSTYTFNQIACNGTLLPLPSSTILAAREIKPARPGKSSKGGCSWTLYQDTQVQGGMKNGASNPKDCMAACEQMATGTCTGINWYKTKPVGQQCIIQTIQDGKHISNPNVDHYDYSCG